MRIRASLFLVAAGAILKWAVTGHVSGLDLPTLGVILMVVGIVGLALSLALVSMRRRTDVIHERGIGYVDGRGVAPGTSRTTYVEPRGYDDPLP